MSSIAYTTLDNDVYALFPTNLTEGMTLVFGGHSIRMTPATGMTMTTGGNVTKTTTSSLSDTDVTERLLYPNVFGPGTAVQYTPTLTGVKEEILLSYNVGKNSFDFLLETDGLVLTETNGQFVLVNPETEQQVGKLGEIIVFDSAGQIVRGNMTAQTIKDGQIYGITISVDQEFLASATYPVAIDPTFRVNSWALDVFRETRYLIEDTALYNHEDAWSYTFESHHYLGKVPYTGNNTYMGNVLYRFPVFYDVSVPYSRTYVSADTLISFKLHLKTITPNSTTATRTVSAVPYLQDWDDSTRICSFQASCFYGYSSPLVSSIQNVPAQGTFEVDLTEYLEHWINVRDGNVTDTADFETGVAICYGGGDTFWIEPVGEDTYTYATYEYSVIPLNTPIYLNSKEMSTFLGVGTQNRTKLLAGRVEEIGQSITWEIVYRGDNLYSLHPNGNMGKYLAGDTLIKNDGDEDFDLFFDGLWRINSFQYGEVIFINECTDDVLMSDIDGTVITISGSDYTNYEKSWRVVRTDAYREADDIQVVSTDIWLAPGEQYDIFQNLNLGNWHFVSKDDFNISVLATSVASLAGTTITGIKPNGFTNIGVYHIPTRKTVLITLRITPLAEGVYFFRNALIGKYMQIAEGEAPEYATNGAPIEAWDFDSGKHQEWILTREYQNYYSIVSAKSGKALTVQNEDVNASGNALAQETNYGFYRQLWKFERTSNGTYVIRPRSSEQYTTDWCMSIDGSTENGTDIVQTAYNSADGSLADKWYVLQPDLYINVLYDNAYQSRYSTRIDNIANDMLAVHERLWTEFEFFVAYSQATLFTSLADECTGDTCECGPCVNSSYNEVTSLHHKNVYNVLYNLPEPQSKRYGVLAYIGHELCIKDGEGEHVSVDYLGMASYMVNKAIVMNPESDAQVLRTTLHEIGHWLKAPDHYGSSGELSTDDINVGKEGNPFNRACIYGEDRDKDPAQTNLIICQGCKNEIMKGIEDKYPEDEDE